MLEINRLIIEILECYGVEHSVKFSKCFSDETAAAVEEIRKIMHLSHNQIIDDELWCRMCYERKSINIFKQIHTM